MRVATAGLWDTQRAKALADVVAAHTGYCGPAVVAWIAAVWNQHRGRSYDVVGRLASRELFPDGPRLWKQQTPGFQKSLNEILLRETDDELRLGDATFYRYAAIHEQLDRHDTPIVIRMYPNDDGLHYVALYRSEYDVVPKDFDRIRFSWQDNGLTGVRDGANPGLYTTNWRSVGQSRFNWGAKRVVRA